MIRAFSVTNNLGQTLRCELENPYADGVNVRNITGIGPEGVNIATNELAMIDGSVFSSQRAPERNIVFDLGFLDMPDGEPVRHLTYKMFSIGTLVRLTFETDERNLYIDGYVESNSPSIFEEEEYAQISVICPDPWFRSTSVIVNRLTNDMTDVSSGFEFDKTYPKNSITFDHLVTDVAARYNQVYYDEGQVLQNPGDRPTGFVLRCTCREDNVKFGCGYIVQLHDSSEPTYVGNEQISLRLARNITLNKGDMLVYSTVPGYRMFYALIRSRSAGVPDDLFEFPGGMDSYQTGGEWLSPGDEFEQQAPYRSQYTLLKPTTDSAWKVDVTQTRALHDAPVYDSSKPLTYPFQYDAERTYTVKAPIASENVYNGSSIITATSWRPTATQTFKNCISDYDYTTLGDRLSRPWFDTSDEAYVAGYRSRNPYGYTSLMSAVTANAGMRDTVLWQSLERGLTEYVFEFYYYSPDEPDPNNSSPSIIENTEKYDFEYELIPLYEGV